MKTNNEKIVLNIRVLDNEQLPEWVKTYTVWVETGAAVQTISSGEIKERIGRINR